MPAEVSGTEPLSNQQTDSMSTATQKPYGELQPNAPVFSYAQAAKGGPTPVPSSPHVGTTISDNLKTDEKRASSSTFHYPTADKGVDSTKRSASETHTPQNVELDITEESVPALSGDTRYGSADSPRALINTGSPSEQPTLAEKPRANTSTPSSPEYGSTSTSTLPKEEDIFSATNGSSDSTSDKQSQTSQNGNKAGEKANVEKEQISTASWDEEALAPAPALKEAAPPPINIWQIRSQAQAKSRASVSTQPPRVANVSEAGPRENGASFGTETNPEPKKDSRKKSRAGQGIIEDKSSSGHSKDFHKSSDTVGKAGLGQVAPPPPSGDTISWPTPDSAVVDGKKRNQERLDKTDKDLAQPPKPHGKEKWVPVPYVPSAVFNTPIPQARRGGRGAARGGREGETRGRNFNSGGSAADKSVIAGAASQQAPPTAAQDQGRIGSNSTVVTSNAPKPKRASSAGPATLREQRKNEDPPGAEKGKGGDATLPKGAATDGSVLNSSRRPSAPTMQKNTQSFRLTGNGHGNESSWSSSIVEHNKDEETKPHNDDSYSTARHRSGAFERRNDSSIRQPEFPRDFHHGGLPNRERGEQRADRSRGGYRGRGGSNHASYGQSMANGHNFSNGYGYQHQPPSVSPPQTHSNHERLQSQTQNSAFQLPHHQPKHFRNNSRSQSITYSGQYGKVTNGHHAGPPHLTNLQTDLANEYGYLPAHQGAMTAVPFNSFGEQPSVFGMVNLQMNYYFSVENLCKDMYLRSHMDSQGFVFLELLAQFNRIKQLTNDMELIRSACQQSQIVEFVSVDGIDRVRARERWHQWVLKMEERDPSARNEGPSQQSISQYSQLLNPPSTLENRPMLSPRSSNMGLPMENSAYHSFTGIVAHVEQDFTTAEPDSADALAIKTPLSAAVSEFAPSTRYSNRRNFPTPDPHNQGTSVFTDAQVENLHILVRKPVHATTPATPPFHSSSSRTFSNGSIDGRSINDELSKFAQRQSRPMMNGDASESGETTKAQRSRSPFAVGSPSRAIDNNVSPPVLWIKDRQNSAESPKAIPNECVQESYHDFRQDALKQRELSVIGKDHYSMQSLYQFWSHFLVRNFNVGMYEEFHRLAVEDATRWDSTTGMRNLLRFYDESILSQKAVSDDKVAQDFVDLIKTERSKSERPVFAKMRSAWRNGAFNMRNRSKLTKFVDSDLKVELER